MLRPSGTAAVRLTLWTLVSASLAMALVQPVHGGTAEAPEITDNAGDQLILDTVPGCLPAAGCQAATRIDILAAWIDSETATQFNVNILLSNVPTGATTATSHYLFHATVAGTEVVSEATAVGGAAPEDAAPGANTAATAIDGNTLIMTIDKSIYGAGGTLTNLFVEGESQLPEVGLTYATDRAPDEGFGTDYALGGGGNQTCPNCTADDTDGDGLNDTWEQEHFGNLTQNGTGDPDGDGLNNTAEQDLGTDPTNPDTDGDGANDKDDPFPLDPSRGGTGGTGTGTGTTTGTSTSRSGTTTGSRTTTTTGGGGAEGGDDPGAPESLEEALERLESDPGYLAMSAGGFLAVLILCIVGIAVRWSL